MAIQPPSVEYVKLSGKCPQVQPWAFSWRSSSGPNTPACTRASCEVASTDSTRFMRAHVDRDHRPRLTGLGLEAAGDARPAPERDDDGVRLEGGAHQGDHLILIGRANHDVGQPTEVAPALAHQVGEALAASVHDAVVVVSRHVLAADGRPRGPLSARPGARAA